jgi:RimJ/RimL family protein N-acetyltransferase
MPTQIQLRDVIEDDLPIFFEYQLDPEANRMAAFTAKDPADRKAFDAHWAKILADDTIIKKTIVVDGKVAGSAMRFPLFGKPSVAYWLGRQYWGKGIATKALKRFLRLVATRPLYASAARDNVASLRVLEKCGFKVIGEEKGFANARGEEVEEIFFELRELTLMEGCDR